MCYQYSRVQWQELQDSWHPPDYEDPAEIAAINEARKNTGEYLLKSADDYIVPDHLKMSVAKVTRQILVLKEEVIFAALTVASTSEIGIAYHCIEN